jgi:hypothetical protein
MGIQAPQLRDPTVHLVNKRANAAGHSDPQDIAGLIGGGHQGAVEKLLVGQLLPRLDLGGAAVLGDVKHGVRRGHDLILQGDLPLLIVLHRQQDRGELRQARLIPAGVGVLLKQNGSRLLFHQDGALG